MSLRATAGVTGVARHLLERQGLAVSARSFINVVVW